MLAVAEEGPDVLYTGQYAEPLARDIQAAGAANGAQLLSLAKAIYEGRPVASSAGCT